MGSLPRRASRLFGRGSWVEVSRIADVLRTETIGGALLLGGTVLALLWANSPWPDSYETLRDTTLGPAALRLDLTVAQWAADGLLAVFFFIAGLELNASSWRVTSAIRAVRRYPSPPAAA